MDEQCLGQWEVEPEQHRWPDPCVEAQDVLTNHLHIGWPICLPLSPIRIAQHCDVIGQGIEPDVHHLAVVARHWHTPAECFAWAANRDILDAIFDKLEELILAKLGHDLHPAFSNSLANLLSKGTRFEVVVLL